MSAIILITLALPTVAYAQTTNIRSTSETDTEKNNVTETIIGTYSSEEEKQEAIREILKQNPNAIIFTDEEEYKRYLENDVSVVGQDETKSRASKHDYHLYITDGLTKINIYYSYYGLKGGYVGSVIDGSWYSNFTGVTIGNEYHEDLLTVKKLLQQIFKPY